MAEMGNGYGSECHLLRYLGRHREVFNARVLDAIGGEAVRWLDFGFDPARAWPDAEWKGLDFLSNDEPAKSIWHDFWPQRGNVPNWDAVGRVSVNGDEEWLLVEAKAHLDEMRSSCTAKDKGGRGRIVAAVEATKTALSVPVDCDWLNGYYQYCNRVVLLHFLSLQNVAARLLFLYFVGDRADPRRICPQDASGWSEALASQASYVGLPKGNALAKRMHTMFLPVCTT